MELRERVLKYLSLYPSVGIFRLVEDLGVSYGELLNVLTELRDEGLVEVTDDVVNYVPWLHGFVEAGYLSSGLGVESKNAPRAASCEKRRVTLLDFVRG